MANSLIELSAHFGTNVPVTTKPMRHNRKEKKEKRKKERVYVLSPAAQCYLTPGQHTVHPWKWPACIIHAGLQRTEASISVLKVVSTSASSIIFGPKNPSPWQQRWWFGHSLGQTASFPFLVPALSFFRAVANYPFCGSKSVRLVMTGYTLPCIYYSVSSWILMSCQPAHMQSPQDDLALSNHTWKILSI